jgi:hypothetical protein
VFHPVVLEKYSVMSGRVFFIRNYNYWGLVSMRAFSLHSLYGYIKITMCSGAALALFEYGVGAWVWVGGWVGGF